MSAVYEVIGYQYSHSGSSYEHRSVALFESDSVKALDLAKSMVGRGNSDLNQAPKRAIQYGEILSPRVTDPVEQCLIAIDLSDVGNKFLPNRAVNPVPYVVLGNEKNFVNVKAQDANFLILEVNARLIREESKKLGPRHLIDYVPVYLNIVEEHTRTTLPILQHPPVFTGIQSETVLAGYVDYHEHDDSGSKLYSHGGFHPPVLNANSSVGFGLFNHGGFHPPVLILDL